MGSVSVEGARFCTQCAAGTYTSLSTCVKYPKGSYSSARTTQCNSFLDGFCSPDGSPSCKTYPAGTFFYVFI